MWLLRLLFAPDFRGHLSNDGVELHGSFEFEHVGHCWYGRRARISARAAMFSISWRECQPVPDLHRRMQSVLPRHRGLADPDGRGRPWRGVRWRIRACPCVRLHRRGGRCDLSLYRSVGRICAGRRCGAKIGGAHWSFARGKVRNALRADVGRHRRVVGYRDPCRGLGCSRSGGAEVCAGFVGRSYALLCGYTDIVEGMVGGGVPSADAVILDLTMGLHSSEDARRGRTARAEAIMKGMEPPKIVFTGR